MRLKMPGRCFSLRALLRDSMMLLAGTVVGILLSRTLFDAPETRLAITKRLTPAAVHLHQETVHLATTFDSRDTAMAALGPRSTNDTNNVIIGTSQPSTRVVNSTQSTIAARQKDDRGLSSMQRRPKTLVQELGGNMRRPLFIGVVTSKALLLTRGKAINCTWSQGTNLMFFSSEGTVSHNLPVVSLPGTDDTYPPQKKVYRMLKYMYDHFINEFNWFMRADDDVYVRVDPLIQFLNKLDPSTDLYIGQPGIGKSDDWDRIQLYPNEHYCMGGPGVILSRSLLVKLAPHLEECLDNVVVSWNEDLEVGRCIMRRLGVQCTWSYEASVERLSLSLSLSA